MKVTRVIHPIGQGGFYTETLCDNNNNEINVVYDCGGFDNRGEQKMIDYLEGYLHEGQSNKKIEAVFISHFHADHINGLEYLLNNAKVRYLFIPQMTEDMFLEELFYNHSFSGNHSSVTSFLTRLYRDDSYGEGEQATKIIRVDYPNDNNISEDFISDVFPNNMSGLGGCDWKSRKIVNLDAPETKILSSNTILYFYKWQYIPYNLKIEPEKADELKEELRKLFKAEPTIENLSSLLEKLGVGECAKIYKKVFGANKMNHISMTLFSGTLEKVSRCRCKCLPECVCYHHCDCLVPYRYCCNPNFLYTGDFEPEKNVKCMRDFYNKYWGIIASIQVPHHGSENNYEPRLYTHPIRGFVSVGNDNTYHHPDIDTLVKIQNNGCCPVIVTEDKSSMKIYHYEIK